MQHQLIAAVHRRIFCWSDDWYGLSLAEVRAIQEKLKFELSQVK
jgi:hypothetical protein